MEKTIKKIHIVLLIVTLGVLIGVIVFRERSQKPGRDGFPVCGTDGKTYPYYEVKNTDIEVACFSMCPCEK